MPNDVQVLAAAPDAVGALFISHAELRSAGLTDRLPVNPMPDVLAWIGASPDEQRTHSELHAAAARIVQKATGHGATTGRLAVSAMSALWPRYVDANAAQFRYIGGTMDNDRIAIAVLVAASVDTTVAGTPLPAAFARRLIEVSIRYLDAMIERVYRDIRPRGVRLQEFQERLRRHSLLEQLLACWTHATPRGKPPADAVRFTAVRISESLNAIGPRDSLAPAIAELRAVAPRGEITPSFVSKHGRKVRSALQEGTR